MADALVERRVCRLPPILVLNFDLVSSHILLSALSQTLIIVHNELESSLSALNDEECKF